MVLLPCGIPSPRLGHALLTSTLASKVLGDKRVGDLSNLVVPVRLQRLDLGQAPCLGDLRGQQVVVDGAVAAMAVSDLRTRLQQLTQAKDPAHPVDGGSNGVLVVEPREEIAQRPDASGVHEGSDLIGAAPGQGVANRPSRLVLDSWSVLGKHLDEDDRNDARALDDFLDSRYRAGGDVGDDPTRLFPYLFLSGRQDAGNAWEQGKVEDCVNLVTVAADNIPDGAKGGTESNQVEKRGFSAVTMQHDNGGQSSDSR
jgi:hypothetical protein